MKRAVAVAALLLLAGACSADVASPTRVERVLVVSLPGVGWEDVERLDLPSIEKLASEGAVGQVATRVGRRGADAGSAYLTIGAGTRAVPPIESAGAALDPQEIYFGEAAAAVFARRAGTTMTGPGYLLAGAASELNEASFYGAMPGALGAVLQSGGISSAVVANADESLAPDNVSQLRREAAAALMAPSGKVSGGSVGVALLAEDDAAPFGLRLDHEAVERAFTDAWTRRERVVALVEASDIRRAQAYGQLSAGNVANAMRDQAIRDADALLAQLLDKVSGRDAVLVLSPIAPPDGNELGVVILRAPGVGGGMLSSATTRRTGYVQLADVAPTVAALTGLAMPERIEGRPFTSTAVADAEGRVAELARDAEEAQFRDSRLPAVVLTMVSVLALLVSAAVFLRRFPAHATSARVSATRFTAFAVLGAVPGTYVAYLADRGVESAAVYGGLVVAVAAGVATACMLLERRARRAGLVAAVALLVAVIAGDVVVGAPLQLNAVFGYSVAVAGRFAGVGNLAFALLSAGALLLAVLLADRYGPSGRRAALAVLVAVVLIDGLPMFGADVGGVLAMVPAFGLTALLLSDRRVGPQQVAILTSAAIGMVLLAAFVDVARPTASRTHLARVAEDVLARRWDRLFDSLARRWAASFGGGELGAWVLLALVAAITALYVLSVAMRGRGTWPQHDPHGQGGWTRTASAKRSWRAALTGIALLAVLGLVANDSSFAVPATMLIVIVPVLVERTLLVEVSR